MYSHNRARVQFHEKKKNVASWVSSFLSRELLWSLLSGTEKAGVFFFLTKKLDLFVVRRKKTTLLESRSADFYSGKNYSKVLNGLQDMIPYVAMVGHKEHKKTNIWFGHDVNL